MQVYVQEKVFAALINQHLTKENLKPGAITGDGLFKSCVGFVSETDISLTDFLTYLIRLNELAESAEPAKPHSAGGSFTVRDGATVYELSDEKRAALSEIYN